MGHGCDDADAYSPVDGVERAGAAVRHGDLDHDPVAHAAVSQQLDELVPLPAVGEHGRDVICDQTSYQQLAGWLGWLGCWADWLSGAL